MGGYKTFAKTGEWVGLSFDTLLLRASLRQGFPSIKSANGYVMPTSKPLKSLPTLPLFMIEISKN